MDEGSLLAFEISALDPDGTNPVLTGTNLPAGAAIVDHGNGTATFSWTPTYVQAGTFTNANIKATDSADSLWFDVEAISITVNDFNPPPVIATIGNKSVDENALLQFTVSAPDPDGTVPTLSASNVPIGASFVDNGNGAGTFTWTPTYAQSGTYTNVTFTATDGGAPQGDDESITITVNNVNRPPQLAAITNQSANENQILQVNVSATDPDGTVPVLSAANAPQGAIFTDNHNGTGTFVWSTGYFDAGVYPGVAIVATDAEDAALKDEKTFTITVNNVNRKPVINPVANSSANEGDTIEFVVSASDPDLNLPALGATDLPPGATFTDHADGTATFAWTADYTASNGSPYTVQFAASDGDKSASTSCTISIANVNLPVTLQPIGNQSAVEGEMLLFAVIGADPDATPAFHASNLPHGAQFLESQIAPYYLFSWTPDYHAAEHSPYLVTFSVTDGEFEQTEVVEIAVADAEAPGAINVTKPFAGSSWARKGKQKTKIKWQTTGSVGNKVSIELWRNGQYVSSIKGGTNNDGGFGWDIPNKMPTGDGYTVRVRSKDNPLIYGESGSFTILSGKNAQD